MNNSLRVIVLVILSVGVGAAFGARFFGAPVAPSGDAPAAVAPGAVAPADAVDSVDDDRRIAELREALEAARLEREALALEVGQLRVALASIKEPRGTRATSSLAEARNDASRSGPRSMDSEVLVDAGFPRQMVSEVKARLDQMELDRLYLRDIATREGWANTRRFREEFEALRFDTEANREEYGDEFYDWMLYATGRPNRVEIDSIMSGSVAEEMGLRAGDQVLRYGDDRVFTTGDLTSGTMAGAPGEATRVEVFRDGRVVRVDVPRGPLGVRVEMTTVEPKPAS